MTPRPLHAGRAAREDGSSLWPLVLVCLIGTAGYFKWRAVRDESNTRAARAVLAADGIAVIDSGEEPDDTASPFQGWVPTRIVRVQSSSNHITDAELSKIVGISQDLNLVLSSCPITNDGLSHLEGRHNIRCLALAKTAVTDDGLKHLRGMNLQSLDLSSTKITDAGLATLGEFDFPRLKEHRARTHGRHGRRIDAFVEFQGPGMGVDRGDESHERRHSASESQTSGSDRAGGGG